MLQIAVKGKKLESVAWHLSVSRYAACHNVISKTIFGGLEVAMLTQVHQASSQDALHVIFVHGLGGNARTTWMSNSADPATFWPEWIGEDVGCNVWIAGYNASPSAWFNETTSLADLGEALFTALQVEPGLQGQSLVLVGHSLGGLAIKSGMTQAESLKDPQRLNLLERISGVVFIGTPHQGAHLATIVNKLSRLLKINPPVGDMTKHNSLLSLQSRQFRSLLTQRSLDVRVFFESKGVSDILCKRGFSC